MIELRSQRHGSLIGRVGARVTDVRESHAAARR